MPCRQAKLLVPVLLLKSSRRSCANDAPCRCKGRVDADRSHLVDTITMNMAVCVVVSVLMLMPTSKTQQDPTAVIFMNTHGLQYHDDIYISVIYMDSYNILIYMFYLIQ